MCWPIHSLQRYHGIGYTINLTLQMRKMSSSDLPKVTSKLAELEFFTQSIRAGKWVAT